jgi:hypothetical protein
VSGLGEKMPGRIPTMNNMEKLSALKIFPFFVDNGDKPLHSNICVNFSEILNGSYRVFRAMLWEKLICEKNQKLKISFQTPFKYTILLSKRRLYM